VAQAPPIPQSDRASPDVRGALDATSKLREWFAFPAAIFVTSRLLLLVLAQQAPSLLAPPRRLPSPTVLPHTDVLAQAWQWTNPWFRFDSKWFVGVAENGYHWGNNSLANTNFLPMYPALIRLLQPLALGSAWLSAWLIANASLFVALVLIWRWARLKWDSAVAERVVLLSAAFPFAFFLYAPYAESLFLALAAGAFLFAEQDRWPAATALAAVSTVTRPVGIALVVALVIMAATRGRRREAAISSLAILPLLAFSGYLAIRFGQPLGFLVNHSGGWISPRGGLLHSITIQFATYLSPFDRIDAAVAGIFLISGIVTWRRLGPGYGAYVLLGVILPLAHGLAGMERYVIVLFPAMATWATWAGKKRQAALFSVSLTGLLIATVMFAAGYALT
jgi:hypothetical protein